MWQDPAVEVQDFPDTIFLRIFANLCGLCVSLRNSAFKSFL